MSSCWEHPHPSITFPDALQSVAAQSQQQFLPYCSKCFDVQRVQLFFGVLLKRDGYCLQNLLPTIKGKKSKGSKKDLSLHCQIVWVCITTSHIPAVKESQWKWWELTTAFWIHLALARCLGSFLEKYSLIAIMQFPFSIYIWAAATKADVSIADTTNWLEKELVVLCTVCSCTFNQHPCSIPHCLGSWHCYCCVRC